MVRRLWAIALLVVAIVTALTVPNLAGQRVPGQSTALPISAPPEIGDCVLSAEAPPKRRSRPREPTRSVAPAASSPAADRIAARASPWRRMSLMSPAFRAGRSAARTFLTLRRALTRPTRFLACAR
jgi:hypothetical protein